VRGDVPLDREFNTLTALAGGKQLLLIGGHSRNHDGAGSDVAVLSVDGLGWERPEGARLEAALHSHTTTSIGRNRLLVSVVTRSSPGVPSGPPSAPACALFHTMYRTAPSTQPTHAPGQLRAPFSHIVQPHNHLQQQLTTRFCLVSAATSPPQQPPS